MMRFIDHPEDNGLSLFHRIRDLTLALAAVSGLALVVLLLIVTRPLRGRRPSRLPLSPVESALWASLQGRPSIPHFGHEHSSLVKERDRERPDDLLARDQILFEWKHYDVAELLQSLLLLAVRLVGQGTRGQLNLRPLRLALRRLPLLLVVRGSDKDNQTAHPITQETEQGLQRYPRRLRVLMV